MTFQASPPPQSPDTPRLDIGAAVGEGWRAFRRAPWTFVGFALMVFALLSFCNLLQNLAGTPESPSTNPLYLLLALLGSVGGLLVNLWGITGLVRGSWCALEGRVPRLATFTRWDGHALTRLFLPQLTLALLLLGLLLLMGVVPAVTLPLAQLGGLLGPIAAILTLTALAALLIFFVYWVITQCFLAQVALVEGPGPIHTLQRGQQVVTHQWGQVLLLAVVEVLLLVVGILALFVGFFAAWPVVAAISTAAYRQLFGTTLHTNLLTAEDQPTSLAAGPY
jgi:uncharacterized membrane protein